MVVVMVEAAEDPLLDMQDPQLLEAIEMFANMSPEEMKETMKELQGMLGDDPETIAAIQEVMSEITNLENGNTKQQHIHKSLSDMIAQDELAAATKDALEMLRNGQWETIWENRNLIRDAVIESGQISPEDAALFRTDQKAWESELQHIWFQLQKLSKQEQEQEL